MRTETPASASAAAGFVPDQDDLDQMARVHAIHSVLDLCPALPLDVRLGLLDLAPDLPMEVRWGLLDYVAGVLEGSRRATSEPRRIA